MWSIWKIAWTLRLVCFRGLRFYKTINWFIAVLNRTSKMWASGHFVPCTALIRHTKKTQPGTVPNKSGAAAEGRQHCPWVWEGAVILAQQVTPTCQHMCTLFHRTLNSASPLFVSGHFHTDGRRYTRTPIIKVIHYRDGRKSSHSNCINRTVKKIN